MGAVCERVDILIEQTHEQRDIDAVYWSYKLQNEPGVLADFIRSGGLENRQWPKGLSEEIANLLDRAYPWTSRKQVAVDDTWIFYLYWCETEGETGVNPKNVNKAAIRKIENWFQNRGTPKPYETIRTRIREGYEFWRDSITQEELDRYQSIRGGENN